MFSMIEATATYIWARFGIGREDGAVTTEYGLLVVFIAIAVIAGMVILAKALVGMFTDAGGQLDTRPS
jgi:Flp pilus assembly pilin Flp